MAWVIEIGPDVLISFPHRPIHGHKAIHIAISLDAVIITIS
jgi:hypothetical protein